MPLLQLQAIEKMVWDRVEQNTLFYPKAEVDAAINESIKVSNLFGGFVQGRLVLGLSIAGRVIYDQPAGMLFPSDVYFDGRALDPQSMQGVSSMQPDWMAGLAGTEPNYWVPIGLDKFALVPNDPDGGRLIEVAGVMEPPPMTNATDTTLLPDEWIDIVVAYSLIKLVLTESGAILESSLKSFSGVTKRMMELSMWGGTIWPDVKSATQSPR